MWWDSDESLKGALSQQVLMWLQLSGQGGVVVGWGPSEIGVVEALAAHDVSIHASDWAVNMASYASFYAPVLQQRQRPEAAAASVAARKHTVSFLLSDGDNLQVIQWLRRSVECSNFWLLQWLIVRGWQ